MKTNKNRFVLVVEDDMALSLTLKELLEDSGFEVKTAKDGKTALYEIYRRMPDLVITDLLMPNLNGYKLFTKIRKEEKFNTLPFIIITANVLIEEKMKLLEWGVNDYIIKPFSFQELVFKINNILNFKENLVNKYEIKFDQSIFGNDNDDYLLNKVNEFILMNIKNSFEVGDIAFYCNVSKSTLDKRIRKITSKNISQYVREFRLEYSIKLMEKGVRSIKKVYIKSGFNSAAYYCLAFKNYKGITPKKFAGMM
jgi:DNA-binding response OmpR family regulator